MNNSAPYQTLYTNTYTTQNSGVLGETHEFQTNSTLTVPVTSPAQSEGSPTTPKSSVSGASATSVSSIDSLVATPNTNIHTGDQQQMKLASESIHAAAAAAAAAAANYELLPSPPISAQDVVGDNQPPPALGALDSITPPGEYDGATPNSLGSSKGESSMSPKSLPNNSPNSSMYDASYSAEPVLRCKWLTCQESFPTPEDLYNHLCEAHVGRRCTNNLSLACRWDSCRVITVKRDHITSHIRVHVPLKPYKCEFCKKTFKRPQDLKKHVKTHADDTLVSRVPSLKREYLYGQPGSAPGSYPLQPHQPIPALVSMNSGPAEYPYPPLYSQQPMMSSQGYSPAVPQMTRQSPPQQHQQQPSRYTSGYEEPSPNRKRAFDATADLFDDIKRSRIAPIYSNEMSNRLSSMESILTISPNTWGYTYYSDPVSKPVSSQTAMQSNPVSAPAANMNNSSRALPSFRSTQELLDADQFLSQLSSNIYSNYSGSSVSSASSSEDQYSYNQRLPLQTQPQPPQQQPQQPMVQPQHQQLPAHSYNHQSSYPVTHNYPQKLGPAPTTTSSSTSMYPVLNSSTDFNAGYPQIASRYEYDYSKRQSVGVSQRAAPPSSSTSVDDLTDSLKKVDIEDKKSDSESGSDSEEPDAKEQMTKHLNIVAALRKVIAELLKEEQAKHVEKDASSSASTQLYPSVAAY
ncbi:alkaline-responsive transcriptional regulator RIM101 [Sugiyamaella lignohabitans]|uniref:Alkaline-responsive transcriptional regulator RIM101 n=1 Tax=Sugiyamaella lignohabitans TaxID=796027 RepID=A0A167DIX4_9ASCO|nr:alkaline-responsive transcriptional regulator RIM101 [Sugiyamaella lignohabitans]ANB12969.1 alkaline-responsive transcriptional regulator RIM101 [Sugiyamaella lignohabitans]